MKNEIRNTKQYDLEARTARFAMQCRRIAYELPRTIVSNEDVKQLVRSSGSVAVNYSESREALSIKDCIHRIKLCKKEARESRLWLQLLQANSSCSLSGEMNILRNEAQELILIFGAIISKLSHKR